MKLRRALHKWDMVLEEGYDYSNRDHRNPCCIFHPTSLLLLRHPPLLTQILLHLLRLFRQPLLHLLPLELVLRLMFLLPPLFQPHPIATSSFLLIPLSIFLLCSFGAHSVNHDSYGFCCIRKYQSLSVKTHCSDFHLL